MADRENVVGHLYDCLAASKLENMWVFVRKDIVGDAIALLKEQEAVPVIQCEIAHMLFWCCGSCGVAITDGDKFCRNCGRKVKWNDSD